MAAGLLSAGCQDLLWPFDSPGDPYRCEEDCASGQVCYKGTCRAGAPSEKCKLLPLKVANMVDVLFVVDNSGSMEQEQKTLIANFPKLIDAIKSAKVNSGLPDFHIGVISADLGAGTLFVDNACITDGDQGKLQYKAQVAGCTPPNNPWIEYYWTGGAEGTNVPGTGTPYQKVKDAFSCIAALGTDGCGYEQTILSAVHALHPAKNVNPGFLRNDKPCSPTGKDALLVVVFITDEDDCSTINDKLFDPSQQGLNDPMGPLTSFRCFEFGVKCECADKTIKCDRFANGARKNCVPGGDYLYQLKGAISFFSGIKQVADLDAKTGACVGRGNPHRVIMAAIAGPTDKVEVGQEGSYPTLKGSCSSSAGFAVPAIRMEALVHAFARQLSGAEVAAIKAKTGSIPYFVDKSGAWREENLTSICSTDYAPALERVARRIGSELSASPDVLCLDAPVLTDNDGLVCTKGDVICSGSNCGQEVKCSQSCLNLAKIKVKEQAGAGLMDLPRCADSLWNPSVLKDKCTGTCPCWRLVASTACNQKAGGLPYALEIMRNAPAPIGAHAKVCAWTSAKYWGTKELANVPQCE